VFCSFISRLLCLGVTVFCSFISRLLCLGVTVFCSFISRLLCLGVSLELDFVASSLPVHRAPRAVLLLDDVLDLHRFPYPSHP
jgi:hypothetical protein